MRIAIVHNQYGKFSGEEAVVRDQAALLRSRGHEVEFFLRSSTELMQMHWGAAKAFFCGIYNPFAVCAFRAFLKEKKPDIVHIHNLYPLISPAILPECTKAGIPVIMSVHNYRLICPNGLLMNRESVKNARVVMSGIASDTIVKTPCSKASGMLCAIGFQDDDAIICRMSICLPF